MGVFGKALAPLAWLTGIPWHEANTAEELLASKVFVNELVAYLQLAALEPTVLSEHSRLIMTYALCAFANFGSLSIMIGLYRRPHPVIAALNAVLFLPIGRTYTPSL